VKIATTRNRAANRSIPTLVAVGISLIAFPAAALELGELTVQSRLGQPLRASIAYALAPNEQIANYCITLRPGASVSGLPSFGTATLKVANGVIMLTGNTPVREPMVSAHIVVNCPYSANLSREYLLFIDPLLPAYEQTAVTVQTSAAITPVAIAPTAVRQPVIKNIDASQRYQVQSGETLSEIASRIRDRSVGLWPAVNAIFAANPNAFLNNDPNQLKAGSWLAIPDFDTTVASTDSVAIESATEATTNDVSEVYVPAPVAETQAFEEAAVIEEALLIDQVDMTSDLKPGDIILDANLQGPITASSSPNVPTAIITSKSSAADGTASTSWLAWLAGSGIALILGLLMFGRRLGNRSGTAPATPQAENLPRGRFSDSQGTDTESVAPLEVDYDLSDDSPTEENLVLDADLILGTGLEESTTADIANDFGFAETTSLDIDLPFEPVATVSDETDILRPLGTDQSSILKSEVMPENDDEDYDMSVIIDATKMPQPEEVTERDLKAVEVAIGDETMITENYTISQEVDYNVVEQDYEDEMTATQALNEEIAKAASELAVRMDEDTEAGNDSATAALPLASVTELDITAQMPAQDDQISDLDDTGINEAVTVNTVTDDETVEMPAKKGETG